MALKKLIIQNNGIPTEYHRIADIQNIVNDKTIIQVYSYISEEQREKEKHQPKYSPRRDDIYIYKSEEYLEYNSSMTTAEAYEYLKTLDKYKDAIDV